MWNRSTRTVACACLVVAALASGWAWAQGSGTGGTTFTTSVQRATRFESPPACNPVGSSRVVTTPAVATTTTIGPACIGVGEVSIPNPTPACGALPPAQPPVDPFHGATFLVAAGDVNIDVQTLIETFQCVSAASGAEPTAVPALPWSGLVALAVLVALAGGWYVSQRSRIE